jgi:hypothetical protein
MEIRNVGWDRYRDSASSVPLATGVSTRPFGSACGRLPGNGGRNRQQVSEELQRAKESVGPTVFDWLVEIIRIHGAAGAAEEDGVELVLE